jgi:hypothetical protein
VNLYRLAFRSQTECCHCFPRGGYRKPLVIHYEGMTIFASRPRFASQKRPQGRKLDEPQKIRLFPMFLRLILALPPLLSQEQFARMSANT